MAQIIPAILSASFDDIRERIARLEGRVPWVQLDIVDGTFAQPASWQTADDLRTVHGRIKIEVHLMTEHPETVVRDWLTVADRVLVHHESSEYIREIIEAGTAPAAAIGIVLNAETPIAVLDDAARACSYIQLMGIKNIGHSGEPFLSETIEKVRTLRAARPAATIAVDGGIGAETIPVLVEAGADVLVVNSALWQAPDFDRTLAELITLASPHGTSE